MDTPAPSSSPPGEQSVCIWCKKRISLHSVEHILPEALACPPNFVLRNCVCRTCNNALGHVDRAVLKEFEILAFTLGVPRKPGKPPRIDGWASICGTWENGGPAMHINAGPGVVEAAGRRLPPAHRSNGIFDAKMHRDGVVGRMSFSQEFGRSPKFGRGLYKIALGAIAYFEGPHFAATAQFDPLRAYVKFGKGHYKYLLLAKRNEGHDHRFDPPYKPMDREGRLVCMQIFGTPIVLDTSPEQLGLREAVQVLEREAEPNDWCLMPK